MSQPQSSPVRASRHLFITSETLPGVLLLIATILALICANTFAAPVYEAVRDFRVQNNVLHALHLDLSIGDLAKDGLLAIFFFVAGLELKNEFRRGSLRQLRTAAVPVAAAAGGVLVPALVYLAITGGAPALAHGWAIPTATDIAFALGILALVAPGLPPALRTFLLTLAVVDDLIAIAIIALFYGGSIQILPLLISVAAIVLFALATRSHDGHLAHWWVLIPLALVAWAAMHASGIHATVAGVLLAFMIPIPTHTTPELAHRLERALSPVSSWVAVPVFAFFAAGVSLGGDLGAVASDPTVWAITAALVLGKPIGVLATSWIMTRFRGFALGKGLTWADMLGLGLLTGVGFTVSLLITELAFGEDPALTSHAKLAVLSGSLIAAVAGGVVLRIRAAQHGRVPTPTADQPC